MTARPTIKPTPADKPWTARKHSSAVRSVAKAHAAEARVNTASPPRITLRRPIASDSGPCTTLIKA
ncbi:hypothetical protein D3C71_2133440 [compost metagenome]